MSLPATFSLPLQNLKQSTNKIYAGIHWATRKRFKDSILDRAREFFKGIGPIESYPVEISYRFFSGTRPLDTLNYAYMAKCIEDSLRSLGILEDDDPAHVAKSSIEVIDIRPTKRPKVNGRVGAAQSEKPEDKVIIYIQPWIKTNGTGKT